MPSILKFSFATMFLLLGIGVLSAEDKKSEEKKADDKKPAAKAVYYPLKEGNTWEYAVKVNGKEGKMTNKCAGKEKVDEVECSMVETFSNGQKVAVEYLANTDKGLLRCKMTGAEMTPALTLLKYPVKDGDSWEEEIKVNGEKAKFVCKVGKDSVDVPAGNYKDCVTVEVTFAAGADSVVAKYWFADNVGVVRQDTTIGKLAIGMELTKFDAAK
jgi:hypothetical protein